MTDAALPPARAPGGRHPSGVAKAWFARLLGTATGSAGLALGVALAIALFCAFAAARGAPPLVVMRALWTSTVTSPVALGEVLITATPLVLAGLAVAVPARAGLINVGGEGQLVIGAVTAAGVGLALDRTASGIVVLLTMAAAAVVAGACWGGVAGALRHRLRVNEAISTLLLNYVAIDLMRYLIFDRWKDAAGSGQPASRPLAEAARLPVLSGTRVHAGILIALVSAVVVSLAVRRTRWGFGIRVTGGNPEAARRAGLAVGRLSVSAMLVGGGLAGLAGMVHLAGAEFQLRQGMAAGLGYSAFLASWLVGHRPLRVVAGALVLAFIVVGGDSLQIDAGLPAASVNILIALVLLAVLGQRRSAAGAPAAT